MENTQPTQTDIPVSTPQDSQQPTLPQTNKNMTLPLILGGLVLACVMGGVGYYLGAKSVVPAPVKTQELVVESSPSPLPVVASPVTTTQPMADSFEKRLFNPSGNWFRDKPYPQQLTSIDESKLIGLKCSPQYLVGGDGGGGTYFSYDEKGAATQLADQDLLNKVAALVKSGKSVSAFMSCKTSTGLNLFEYEEQRGGGGSGTTAFFGALNGETFTEWASVPNPGIAYFTCTKSLQFTNGLQWYVACGGGDGNAGGENIYKIDGSLKKVSQVFSCSAVADELTCM